MEKIRRKILDNEVEKVMKQVLGIKKTTTDTALVNCHKKIQ